MSITPPSPERASLTPDSPQKILLVEQPKSARLDLLLAEIEQITESPAQSITENSAGTGAGTKFQTSSKVISPREVALASLPDLSIMQTKLTHHIENEITILRQEARHVTRLGHPGHAYQLNEIYRKIRQLQSLLFTFLEASYEVLRRLFVRVIIDRQPIL